MSVSLPHHDDKSRNSEYLARDDAVVETKTQPVPSTPPQSQNTSVTVSTSTLFPDYPSAGPSSHAHSAQARHHVQAHTHAHHHRSPRVRPRSESRSSSSPSPPPASPRPLPSINRPPRRSFSSRSPGAAANRRSSKHDSSPLNGSFVPLESPTISLDDTDFSTRYGASASSPGVRSASEYEEDRYVSYRGGDETEKEADTSMFRKRGRTSSAENELGAGSGSPNGAALRRDGSDVTLPDRV